MKTTELYVEQVLIGLLIIAIGVSPCLPEVKDKIVSTSAIVFVAEGSFLLGLAFWLGILFDRLADTLSERLDRHNRLQFALNNSVGKQLPREKHDDKAHLTQDIFPEDRLRLKSLRDEDGIVNWLDYHRSRIRLGRALAVYGPALTYSLTMGISRFPLRHTPLGSQLPVVELDWYSLAGVSLAYLLWAFLANPPKMVRSIADNCWLGSMLFGANLPRTDAAGFLKYAKDWNRVNKDNQVTNAKHSEIRIWWSEGRILLVPLLLLAAAARIGFRDVESGWAAGMGILMTVLSSWSWWRISTTFRSYLSCVGVNNPIAQPQ